MLPKRPGQHHGGQHADQIWCNPDGGSSCVLPPRHPDLIITKVKLQVRDSLYKHLPGAVQNSQGHAKQVKSDMTPGEMITKRHVRWWTGIWDRSGTSIGRPWWDPLKPWSNTLTWDCGCEKRTSDLRCYHGGAWVRIGKEPHCVGTTFM